MDQMKHIVITFCNKSVSSDGPSGEHCPELFINIYGEVLLNNAHKTSKDLPKSGCLGLLWVLIWFHIAVQSLCAVSVHTHCLNLFFSLSSPEVKNLGPCPWRLVFYCRALSLAQPSCTWTIRLVHTTMVKTPQGKRVPILRHILFKRQSGVFNVSLRKSQIALWLQSNLSVKQLAKNFSKCLLRTIGSKYLPNQFKQRMAEAKDDTKTLPKAHNPLRKLARCNKL